MATFMLALSLASCTGDGAFAPITDSATGYWSLRLNHHAIQLSLHPPYNTIQLEATPRTIGGDLWVPRESGQRVEDALVTYYSTDSTKVRVTPTGLVQAWDVQTGTVYIVAVRRLDGVTHADSALVRVANVATAPVVRSLKVGPEGIDSITQAIMVFAPQTTISIAALDTNGVRLTGYPVYIKSSNPYVVKLSNSLPWVVSSTVRASVLVTGKVTIVAESWIYGVTVTDTLWFTAGYAVSRVFAIGVDNASFESWSITDIEDINTVSRGAVVGWRNSTGCPFANNLSCIRLGFDTLQNGQPLDIIFDDPVFALPAEESTKNTGGGNIVAIPSDTVLSGIERTRYRTFSTPGRYPYRVLPLGIRGTVIVSDL